MNLVRLGWYLTPLGLGLACLGFILALRQLVLNGQVRPLPYQALNRHSKELIGVGEQFREYAFPISPGAIDKGPTAIRFKVHPIWNPSLAGASADYRNLGCAVQWIRIEKL